MDVSKAYTGATRTHVPHARICYDPFHIMQWVNRALDAVYAEGATGPGRAAMSAAQLAHHPLGKLSAAEAADRVGCVEHDILRLRRRA